MTRCARALYLVDLPRACKGQGGEQEEEEDQEAVRKSTMRHLCLIVSLLHLNDAVWSMPPHPLLYGIGRGDTKGEEEGRRGGGEEGGGGREGRGGSEELRNAFSGTNARIGT